LALNIPSRNHILLENRGTSLVGRAAKSLPSVFFQQNVIPRRNPGSSPVSHIGYKNTLWPTDFRRYRVVHIIGHGMCPEYEKGGKNGPEYSFSESQFVGKIRSTYVKLLTARPTNDINVCHKYSVFFQQNVIPRRNPGSSPVSHIGYNNTLWPTDFRRYRVVHIIGHGMCPECERGGKNGPEYSFWESHFVGKIRIIYGKLFATRPTNDVRKIGWSSGKTFAINTLYFSNKMLFPEGTRVRVPSLTLDKIRCGQLIFAGIDM
jgi:hypothetical protein